MSTSQSQSSILSDSSSACGRIDVLLRELDGLATSESASGAFYEVVLHELVESLGAEAGAVWRAEVDGSGEPSRQVPIALLPPEGHELLDAERGPVLRAIGRKTHAQWLPTSTELRNSPDVGDSVELAVLAVPVHCRADDKVIALLLRRDRDNAEQRTWAGVMEAVAEICEGFERNLRLRELESREHDRQRFQQLAVHLHGSLDLRQTTCRIANDLRHFLECDRVTVAVRRDAALRTAAISGLDSFDRRSPAIRLLETLAARAATAGETVWSDQLPDDIAPQIIDALEAYRDESHVRSIGLIPLFAAANRDRADSAAVGLLLIEQFTGPLNDETCRQASAIAGHAGAALGNAIEHSSLPLLFLGKAVRRRTRVFRRSHAAKWGAGGAALLATVAFLLLVKTDFTVEARGSLEPLQRREVFAPTDGVIVHVAVDHGQRVRQGQELLQVRDDELEFELQRVLGELQTARQRLAAVETLRIDSTESPGRDPLRRMTADEEELKQLLQGLEEQYAMLKTRQSRLAVTSPMDGDVLTWDARHLLEMRPVRRGQSLLTVADRKGPWVLKVEVAEADIVHVRAARRAQRTIAVDYALATNPGRQFRGVLADLGPAAQPSDHKRRTVPAQIETSLEAAEATPGVSAIARIHCGRRAVGYVWFRDVIEAARSLWPT